MSSGRKRLPKTVLPCREYVYLPNQTPNTVKTEDTASKLNGTTIRRMNLLFQPLRHALTPV